MKENNFKKYLLVPLVCMFFGTTIAQSLYIGDGGAFYLSATSDFTTSNTLVTHHANGVFAVEAGTPWVTATEYVDGKMTVLGAGTTVANIGDGEQSTVTITTAAGDAAIVDSTLAVPTAGDETTLGNLVLSDTEFWTVTNTGSSADLAVADLTENASATYSGNASEGAATIIVRLDAGVWKAYSGSTGLGTFALAIEAVGVKLSPIVFLQGAYVNPVGGEETWMRDNLRVASIIPTTSPYADVITCDASVFTPTGADAIVDWVWVELRDKNDNTNTLGSRSALLQRDGDVVDVDGTSSVDFSAQLTAADDFYVVIAHRNHLGVITASTVALSAVDTTVDFSVNNTMQNGGDLAVALLNTSLYGIYGGDYDGNGQAQNIDVTQVRVLVGGSGFSDADIDMNTQIQNLDYNMIRPNVGRGELSRSQSQIIITAPLSDLHKSKKQ